MSIKSILRAVGARFTWSGTDIADVVRKGSQPGLDRPMPSRPSNEALSKHLDRLTSRSDWAQAPQPIVSDGEGVDPNRPPSLGCGTLTGYADRVNANSARPNKQSGPWEDFERRMAGKSPVWPATDDPYAKPEPCPIVQDPGLERVRKLTDRGLVMLIGDKSTLSQIMELIDRQEDAEQHLKKIGMIWEKGRGWYLP